MWCFSTLLWPLTHLLPVSLRRRRVAQRHPDHRLPDMGVRAVCCHFKLDRFVQAASPHFGKDGPICPHAEDGVSALERHLFIPHAVIKLHCGQKNWQVFNRSHYKLRQLKTVNRHRRTGVYESTPKVLFTLKDTHTSSASAVHSGRWESDYL